MTSLPAPDGRAASRQPYRWTVPGCALLGLGLALLVLGLRSPTYQSIARVTVNNPIGTMQDEATIAGAPLIIDAAAGSLGFVPDVSVDANEVAKLLTITSRADSPGKAADAANAVANTYVQAQTTAAVGVATPAEPNNDPVGAGALSYMLIGSLVGAIAGIVLSGVMMVTWRRPPKRRGTREVPTPTWTPMGGPGQPDQPAEPEPPAVVDLRTSPPRSTAPAAPVPSDRPQNAMSSTPVAPGPDHESTVSTARRRAAAPRATGSSPVSELSSAFATAAAEAEAEASLSNQVPLQAPAPLAKTDRLTPYSTTVTEGSGWGSSLELDEMQTTRWSTESSSPTAATTRWGDAVTTADPARPAVVPPDQPLATPALTPATLAPTFTTPDEPAPSAPSWDQSTFSAMTAPADRTPSDDSDSTEPDPTNEARRYQLVVEHELQVADLKAGYDKTIAELRSEISGLNRQVRGQASQLKRMDGNDQHRVGDLEAQIVALDAELAGMREQLERDRIANTRRLTEERGSADRALDNARREYREELAKHEQVHRASLSEHRADLDRTLTEDRAKHAEMLEAQHRSYENALENERVHRSAEFAAVTERHQRELADANEHARLVLERQSAQHKDTITSLRDTAERSDAEVVELQKLVGGLRTEIATLQQQARHLAAEHLAANQKLVDQLAVSQSELSSERERNAALRADVLRRSAEAHAVVDRALEERTAQLGELEAAVARQREYSDTRVREVSTAAEERARQSTLREADLSAKVSRLERELAQLRNQGPAPADTAQPE